MSENEHAGPAVSRRRVLGTLAAAGGAAIVGGATGAPKAGAATLTGPARRHTLYPPYPRHVHDPVARDIGPGKPEIACEVVNEFRHAWAGYVQFAYGHDEVHPISGTSSEFFVPGHPIGLSIIEALDTFYVMGLDEELYSGATWIEHNVDFDIDGDFHVFEAIIRVVGGLLAGYLATGQRSLLEKCRDLADRLTPAFTKSPTGMPYQYVNLHTGEISGPNPPLAEIGTNALEFGVLSQLTGNPLYYGLSKRAFAEAIKRRSHLDLLGSNLDVETGQWTDTTDVAPNPPVDSFYEYPRPTTAIYGTSKSITGPER